MISRETIQKVNDTAEIIDVVGSFIKLKKRGANYLGNCPFHNEKTPSFTVSPSKGIYKCFGCGKAGNVITFIQEHEKLTYPEAITWLAKRYHIEIQETEVSQEAREQMQMEESLRIINTFAANYFHEKLLQSEEGQLIGLSYFKERGFRDETLAKFQLGYCPEQPDTLTEDAKAKGYKTELLVKAGLIYDRNGYQKSIYHGRVTFPIHNQSGKVIGFGARILKTSEKAPKYINTPENELYHKSKSLYGIYHAKNSIAKLDECYLVEGYTDVISLHQSGVENVVASSGTSLTEDQLKLIKRFTKNLTILYDGDAAGIKAALRGLDMAIEQGLNVHVVLLPDNHDPDSYIQQTGADGFVTYIKNNRKDIILFKLEASLSEARHDSVKKTALINEIAETLSKINKLEDFTKQDDYIRRCSQLLQIDEAGLISLVNKKIREKAVKRDGVDRDEIQELEKQAAPEQIHEQGEISDLLKKDYLQEKGLLRILLEYGDRPYDEQNSIAEYINIKIGGADYTNEIWGKLYECYQTIWQKSGQYPQVQSFTYHDDEQIRSAAIEALYFPYELSEKWLTEHNIATPSREMTLHEDVNSTVTYFMLRKIKSTYLSLLENLQHPEDAEDEAITLTAYKTLKETEAELLKHIRTVATR
jgi:DNA primase